MTENVEKMLAKAIDALQDAEALFALQRHNGAVNRAYYAIFSATQALLAVKNLHSKTHQGCHNLFYEHYVRTGLFDKNMAQKLHENFELRQVGDYDYEASILLEDAEFALKNAIEFIDAVKKHIE